VERRTLPGESVSDVTAELAGILDRIASEVPDFAYGLTPGVSRPPLEADSSSVIRTVLERQVDANLDRSPVIRGEAFWTDAALLEAAGIPSLLFGVTGGGAHAATEYVEVSSLLQLTDVLTGTIQEFCG
jgi:acetylornithine deacetylase